LVTNDPNSGTTKNQKAQSLGIPIITEKEFLELIKWQE
jgi:DNA ligase (NAD+)